MSVRIREALRGLPHGARQRISQTPRGNAVAQFIKGIGVMRVSNRRSLRLMLALLVGAYLLSDPRCDRGCKTLAGHLLTHGIEGLFG